MLLAISLAIVAGLVFGAASYMVSALRWRGGFFSFLLGFLLGPIGLLIALAGARRARLEEPDRKPPRLKKVVVRCAYLVFGFGMFAWVVTEILLADSGKVPPPPATVSMDLHGGHVVGNRIQTKSWTFDYTKAHLSPDGLTGSVDGVRAGVIFRKGKPYLRISAQHIQVDVQSLNFTAIGKMHIERIGDPQHLAFDTDHVVWTNDAKSLKIDHPAFIHTNGQTLRVDHISVDFDANTVHIGKIGGQLDVHTGKIAPEI
jgi:hypothetical protein